jgi:hypothetical protein
VLLCVAGRELGCAEEARTWSAEEAVFWWDEAFCSESCSESWCGSSFASDSSSEKTIRLLRLVSVSKLRTADSWSGVPVSSGAWKDVA